MIVVLYPISVHCFSQSTQCHDDFTSFHAGPCGPATTPGKYALKRTSSRYLLVSLLTQRLCDTSPGKLLVTVRVVKNK